MAEPSNIRLRSLVTMTVDATSPASATYQVGTGVAGFSQFKALSFLATITGGTGGVIDVIVEHSNDGVAWYEYVHFPQVAAVTAKTYVFAPTPTGNVQVGKNNADGSTLTTSMTLTAGDNAPGPWFDQMRVRYVAGAGTSVGAAQAVAVLCMRETGLS